jgi:hypothetical protein
MGSYLAPMLDLAEQPPGPGFLLGDRAERASLKGGCVASGVLGGMVGRFRLTRMSRACTVATSRWRRVSRRIDQSWLSDGGGRLEPWP